METADKRVRNICIAVPAVCIAARWALLVPHQHHTNTSTTATLAHLETSHYLDPPPLLLTCSFLSFSSNNTVYYKADSIKPGCVPVWPESVRWLERQKHLLLQRSRRRRAVAIENWCRGFWGVRRQRGWQSSVRDNSAPSIHVCPLHPL